MHIRQAEIAAGVTEGQAFVIEPHQVKNRRMKIVDVHRILRDAIANVVGLAIDRSAS